MAKLSGSQISHRRSHALNLLFRHGPDVKGAYYCAHITGSLNASQSCDSNSQDENFRRGNLPSRSHLAGEETAKDGGRFNHGAVTSDVGLRAEGVEGLGAG